MIKAKSKTIQKGNAKKDQVNSGKLVNHILTNRISKALNTPKKKITVGILTALILIVLAVLFIKGYFIAVIVNGEIITRIELIKQLEEKGGKNELENIIIRKIILQEARKRNIQVSQAEVDEDLKKIEDGLKNQGTTLEQALASQGLSRSELNEEIRIQLSIQKMVGGNIKVSDKEISDFINTNKDKLPQGVGEQELRKQAISQITQQKKQEETQKFVEELRQKAKIIDLVKY